MALLDVRNKSFEAFLTIYEVDLIKLLRANPVIEDVLEVTQHLVLIGFVGLFPYVFHKDSVLLDFLLLRRYK